MSDEIGKYIPLDKSWMIRLGVLDILHGCQDIVEFLGKQERLSDDLQALYRAARDWRSGKPINVGESATLYRALQFLSWEHGLNKEFRLEGTLIDRDICDDQSIVFWEPEKLLTLDGGTTQWATAAYLAGDRRRVQSPEEKLQDTYDAVEHWESMRAKGECWEPRKDETLKRQALAYLEVLSTGKTNFDPRHSEDYCFARAFGRITLRKGAQLWGTKLANHESDRIPHLEEMLKKAERGEFIDSQDHRVVQAVAMRQKVKGLPVRVKDRSVVNKSWPEFWNFLAYARSA
jgi:hypothetical protein